MVGVLDLPLEPYRIHVMETNLHTIYALEP